MVARSRIARKPLAQQCELLHVHLNQMSMRKMGNEWCFKGRAFSRPEGAALATFQEQGYKGASCEGGPILMALKAAGFKWIVEHNTFSDRRDAVNRYLEAAVDISKAKRSGFVDSVARSSDREFLSHFREIYSSEFIQNSYPGLTVAFMKLFRESLGKRLVDIAAQFVESPYEYRAGWPDLTLVKGGKLFSKNVVQFVEVKTTDSIHTSQERIINDIVKPLSLPFFICQLVPE